MGRLKGSKYSTLRDEITDEGEQRWRNVNIAMKPDLLNRIDWLLEEGVVGCKSRSKFVRTVVLKELEELEEKGVCQ